jgi:hypothetical protein
VIGEQKHGAHQELSGSRANAGREPQPLAGRWSRESLRCPACRLVLTPRALTLTPHHCPRCLARWGLAVELEPHTP